LKLLHACDQWHSSGVSIFLTNSHCKLCPNTEGFGADEGRDAIAEDEPEAKEKPMAQQMGMSISNALTQALKAPAGGGNKALLHAASGDGNGNGSGSDDDGGEGGDGEGDGVDALPELAEIKPKKIMPGHRMSMNVAAELNAKLKGAGVGLKAATGDNAKQKPKPKAPPTSPGLTALKAGLKSGGNAGGGGGGGGKKGGDVAMVDFKAGLKSTANDGTTFTTMGPKKKKGGSAKDKGGIANLKAGLKSTKPPAAAEPAAAGSLFGGKGLKSTAGDLTGKYGAGKKDGAEGEAAATPEPKKGLFGRIKLKSSKGGKTPSGKKKPTTEPGC
jgi:hypothetical protein